MLETVERFIRERRLPLDMAAVAERTSKGRGLRRLESYCGGAMLDLDFH